MALLPWPVTVESRRARSNLTPEQLRELAKDPKSWYQVPFEGIKDVFAAMWSFVSKGLDDCFIPIHTAIDSLLCKLPSLESLKAPIWKLIMMFSGGVSIQPDRAAGVIFNYLKPTALTMILQQHKNTRRGWLATLTALVELYSSVLSLGDTLIGFITSVSEYLYSFAKSAWRQFKAWWSSLSVAQAGLPQAVLLTGVFGFLYYLTTQTVPGKNLTHHLLKAAGILSGVSAAIKSIQWLQDYFRDSQYNARVQMYMTRHSALLEVMDSHADAGTFEAEGLLRCCQILVEEGTQIIQERPTHATAGLLRSYVSTLEERISRLTQTVKMDTPRPVPQFWVFGGLPGIGKTRLVEHVAKLLGERTSTFSACVDHHDSYTGNPTAIWDEFDVDKKGEFIETVISMVNSSVFPLNCDRPENKGKTFTSKYILATTNCPTPVLPTHPRSQAFWRRVNFVDVTAPELESWQIRYPGRQIPKNLFKQDFSHLELRLRPFMGVDPDGNLVDGRRAAVARITVDDLPKLIKNKFEAQANNPHILWIKMPAPMITESVTRLTNWVKFSSAVAKVVTSVTEAQIQFRSGPGFIVCSDKSAPAGDILELEVDGFRQPGPPPEECNNLQDLFTIVNGRAPSHVLRSVLYEVAGHSATIHDQTLPVSAVPRPKNMVVVTYPGDLIGPLWKHLSLRSIPGLWKLIKGYYACDNYFTLLSTVVENLQFGPNPECTLFRTPNGDIILYTCGGSIVFGTPARYPLISPANYPNLRNNHPTNSSWFDLLITFFHVVSVALLPYIPLIVTTINLSYLTSRSNAEEEAKGKTKRGRGRHAHALNDDDYEEWRDIRKDWRQDMTAQEFITLRNKAAAGGMDQESQRYRAWLELRALRASAGAYRHAVSTVIGGGRVREEVHRLDMMRAPLRAIEEDIEPEGATTHLKEFTADDEHVGWGVHIGNGRIATCTHVAKTATLVDDSPFQLERVSDDLAIVTSNCGGPFKSIGQGDPSFYLDQFNPVKVLENGMFETPTTTVQGWTVKILNGKTTKKGDCGLPYYNLNGQLVGLHAGSTVGGSIKLVVKLKPENTPPIEQFAWKGLMVSRSTNVGGMPTGTRYHRSPAFPTMLPTEKYEPAPFGIGDARYTFSQVQMMIDALKPYQETPFVSFDPLILQRGVEHTRVALRSLIGTHTSKNLSFTDACRSLERSTSCGPFVPGVKSDYWDESEEQFTGELRVHLERAWDAAQRGQTRPNAYKLALKDELRPVEKNQQGKRRLLWGADAAVTLLCTAVFKPISERLAQCVPINPIAVGTNMDSPQVEQMNAALTGRVVYNVDYKKWDSTMQPPIINAAISLLAEWAEPSVLTSVATQILSSPAKGHFEDVVFTTKTGLPSGMPFTSVVNSLCHMILFSMSVLSAYEKYQLPYNGNTFENEVVWTYGDDGLYGLTMATASLMDDILANMRSFGLNPTGADKSDNIQPTVTPVFLKREFRLTDHGVRALLDPDSIRRQFYWVKAQRTSDPFSPPRIDREVRTQQLTVALAMASQHGPEFYEEMSKLAQQCASAEGLVLMTCYSESLITYNNWYVGVNTEQLSGGTEPPEKLVFEMEGAADGTPAGGASAPPPGTATDATAPTVTTGALVTSPATQMLDMMANSGATPTTIPLEVSNTFAVVQNVTWTTRQSIGTVLASFPLGPQINPYLSHMSAMWGAWGGGLEIRITVSGSGMFAGRLMAALVPPGVDPQTIRAPGALPHAMIDARVTDPVVFPLPDVRSTNYHLMNSPGDVPTLGLWVFNPLINPFGSTEVISACTVTVESRPSADFNFGMLLPPLTNSASAHTPQNLLPRRLGFTRGNRVGGQVVGATISATGSQVNHHWNASGTTFGWSLGPVDLLRVQTTSITGNAPPLRMVQGVDCPIIQGVPNHWPDFAASHLISGITTFTTAGVTHVRGAASPALSANGATFNTDMTTARCLLYCSGTLNSTNTPTLVDYVSADSLFVCSTATSANVGGGEWVSNRMVINGDPASSTTMGSSALSLRNGARVVGPIGTNNVLLWQEQTWSDSDGMGTVLASQLETTSAIFAEGPVSIPPNMFAVFSVSSAGGDWQIGITPEGYCYTGAAVGNSITLGPDTTFSFVGLFPYNTILTGFSTSGGHPAF
nr:polyprotein [Bat sapovirus BtSY2]